MAQEAAVDVDDRDRNAGRAPERLADRRARACRLLRRLREDAHHLVGAELRAAIDAEAGIGLADEGAEGGGAKGGGWRLPRAVEVVARGRGAARSGFGVGVGQSDAVGQDAVGADQVRGLEAAGPRRGRLLLGRRVEVAGIGIDGVRAVALDADAAHQLAVLVERQAARVGRQPGRQRRRLHVAAGKARELDTEERTAGREVDEGREMVLDDEARRPRRERVAAAGEERAGAGLGHRHERRRQIDALEAAPAPALLVRSGPHPRSLGRARHAEAREDVAFLIGDGDVRLQPQPLGLGGGLPDDAIDLGRGQRGIGGDPAAGKKRQDRGGQNEGHRLPRKRPGQSHAAASASWMGARFNHIGGRGQGASGA